MDWRGKKILVTGGAGFLGSNLCHALAERGARVTALDGFLFGGGANPANLEGAAVELVRADIREIDLRPLCEGAAVIFNLAAQTSHMGGQHDPLADIAVNAVAQVRLIAGRARGGAARRSSCMPRPASSTAARAGCRSTKTSRSRRRTPTACRNSPASNTGCWNTACSAGRWSRCG